MRLCSLLNDTLFILTLQFPIFCAINIYQYIHLFSNTKRYNIILLFGIGYWKLLDVFLITYVFPVFDVWREWRYIHGFVRVICPAFRSRYTLFFIQCYHFCLIVILFILINQNKWLYISILAFVLLFLVYNFVVCYLLWYFILNILLISIMWWMIFTLIIAWQIIDQ